ncbi:MAG: serine hydrolase [bacterium]|nr:serine hydrolase [bacterium]
MNERALKTIFTLIVILFIIIGKNIASVSMTANKIEAQIISEYKTASLIANSSILPEKDINFPKEEFRAIDTGSTTLSSSVEKLPNLKTIEVPSVDATAFLIGDINRNENVAEYSLDKRWPIASITKLMTAVVALEEVAPDTYITVGINASNVGGSSDILSAGKIFKIEDLIKAMMVTSSNQAATAIQEFVGKKKFVYLMNLVAARLGMHDTYYVEATGLSVLNQSTAYDLKILAYYIWDKHNEIFSYSTLPEIKILDKSMNSSIIIRNINSFVGRKDFLGGKTGFIIDSGGNLISIFSRSGSQVITIVLGADDRFLETKKLMQWFDAYSQ